MTPPNVVRRPWPGEEGIALVLAMFMVLVVSLIGASLATLGRTETMSSLNYKTMSQARYAAESGLHSAANYLIHTYQPPGTDAGDPINVFDTTKSPVRYMNSDVILTSDTTVTANYPIEAKRNAFKDGSKGELTMPFSKATYKATAKLLSMRRFPDAFSGSLVTIQTWEITGTGSILGAGAADVQVSAIIETQAVPAFRYAAFATYNGCDALRFGGGGTTDSYDSTKTPGVAPGTFDMWGGNVGTNGNLSEVGNPTSVHGSLSTPRSGVGNCTTNNVTALTIANENDLYTKVTGGLVELPQAVKMETPAAISPAPPTSDTNITKTSGCSGAPSCVPSTDGVTFSPATSSTVVSLGNVKFGANAKIHLGAGIYEWNSISGVGNAELIIDSGPVIFRIAGKNADGTEMASPIDLAGGVITNSSYSPAKLQFVYGGSGDIKIAGNTSTAALIYAPNAGMTLNGGSNFYGAIVAKALKDMGGTAIHYDRNLEKTSLTDGNPTMTSFNWSTY